MSETGALELSDDPTGPGRTASARTGTDPRTEPRPPVVNSAQRSGSTSPPPGAPGAGLTSRSRRVFGRSAALRSIVRSGRRALVSVLDRSEAALDPVMRPLVAAVQRRGGGPTADDLLEHYRKGEFLDVTRWGRLRWRRPRRRASIPLTEGRVPKSVARLLRAGRFEVTFDRAFADVVGHCATVRGRADSGRSWLTPALEESYRQLHERGYAHSVEVWRDGDLVGGAFGVAVGGLYSGESTFFLESNASKVALARLNERLRDRGFVLHDTQMLSPLVRQFGAYQVSRAEYLALLREALAADVTFV